MNDNMSRMLCTKINLLAQKTVLNVSLLKKLEIYGIKGANLAWFRGYLTNRKQYICINNDNKTY